MNTRSPDAVIDLRVAKVVEMLLAGAPRRDIVQHCADEWDIRTRQADKYIAKARKEIGDTAERSRAMTFGLAQRRLNVLFQRSMAVQDYRTALAVVREQNVLHDLTTTRHHEVDVPGGIRFELTDDADSD